MRTKKTRKRPVKRALPSAIFTYQDGNQTKRVDGWRLAMQLEAKMGEELKQTLELFRLARENLDQEAQRQAFCEGAMAIATFFRPLLGEKDIAEGGTMDDASILRVFLEYQLWIQRTSDFFARPLT